MSSFPAAPSRNSCAALDPDSCRPRLAVATMHTPLGDLASSLSLCTLVRDSGPAPL
jgi:hypothetical protein